MITLRCTKKLLMYLEIDPIDEPSSSTGRLGDWYANLVPTYAGDLIMFVNEKNAYHGRSSYVTEWRIDFHIPI